MITNEINSLFVRAHADSGPVPKLLYVTVAHYYELVSHIAQCRSINCGYANNL